MLNTLVLAWMLTDIQSSFIYGDWLWVFFFLVLGVYQSNVIQNVSLAVVHIQQGLHPKITAWYVGD